MYLCVCMLSHSVTSNSVTLWAVACWSPPSMGFSRQEYWSGSLCPPPGDLPDSEIKPTSPAWQVDSLPLSCQGSPLQATPNGEISKCMSVAQSCLTLCDPTDCSPPWALLSMGFSRQEYCSGLSFPSPEDLANPGIEPWSPALQADSLPFELQGRLVIKAKTIDISVL